MKWPQPVGETLDAGLPLAGARSAELVSIARRWPAAVGEAVAREAWPARLSADRTLIVSCSSAVWASELTHLTGPLSEALERAGVSPAPSLRFVVGQVPRRPAKQPVRLPPSPRPDELEQAHAWASEVSDAPSRERIAAALATVLAARRERSEG